MMDFCALLPDIRQLNNLYYCFSLKTVICEISTPISDGNMFVGTPINEATLYVPEASLASYKTKHTLGAFSELSCLLNRAALRAVPSARWLMWRLSMALMERDATA